MDRQLELWVDGRTVGQTEWWRAEGKVDEEKVPEWLEGAVARGMGGHCRLGGGGTVTILGLLPRPLLRRWLTESARWLVMVGKSHQALRELQKVARINGKKEEGDKLDIEVKGSSRVPRGVPGVFYRGPLTVHPMDNCPSMAICVHHPLKHPVPPSIHLHHLSHLHHLHLHLLCLHLHQSHPSLSPIHGSNISIPPSIHDLPPPLPPILPRPSLGHEGPQCPTPIPEPPCPSRP